MLQSISAGFSFSLFHGFCEKRNLSAITSRDPPTYIPVVANVPEAVTVAFIAPGPAPRPGSPQPNVMYVSAPWTGTGQNIWRERVSAFASRSLDDFNLAYSDSFGQTHITIEIQQREDFPVKYVYGFGTEGFSYVMTVQRRSITSENFGSTIFRVCQNDQNFYSYVEMPIKCVHEGVDYNLAQAAYVTKAGLELANSLNIHPKEDVLFAVFSQGLDEESTEPSGKSALCVYPMRLIRRSFTQAIRKCFSGVGNIGPPHIRKPLMCLRNTQVRRI